MIWKKTLAVLTATAGMAGACALAPSSASAEDLVGAAVAAPFVAAGAAADLAFGGPPAWGYDYGPGYAYVAPPGYVAPGYTYEGRPGYTYERRPGYAYEEQHVYSPAPGRGDWMAYCSAKYRSFDPGTGTYLGYDGFRHECR